MRESGYALVFNPAKQGELPVLPRQLAFCR